MYQIEGYIVLRISETFLLEFSSPQMTGVRKSDLTGVGININVNDVKKEYEEMLKKGVEIDMHLKEHEWGEIAFSIIDPNGLMIYVCKIIEK